MAAAAGAEKSHLHAMGGSGVAEYDARVQQQQHRSKDPIVKDPYIAAFAAARSSGESVGRREEAAMLWCSGARFKVAALMGRIFVPLFLLVLGGLVEC